VIRITAQFREKTKTVRSKEANMNKEKSNLLLVLKKHLEFLEAGGYRDVDGNFWCPQLLFLDSPVGLYFEHSHSTPGGTTAGSLFEQSEPSRGKTPSLQVPLNGSGNAADFFYSTATQNELERPLKQWLMKKIEVLQSEMDVPR
jgi:hypothetical protein